MDGTAYPVALAIDGLALVKLRVLVYASALATDAYPPFRLTP